MNVDCMEVNIHSHLIGAGVFFALPWYLYRTEIPPRYAMADLEDKVVFFIYFVSVAICFCLSATSETPTAPQAAADMGRYHTVMCHSQKMDMLGAQLDFQGVILLMWSATIPLVFYGFYCQPVLKYGYWLLVIRPHCPLGNSYRLT